MKVWLVNPFDPLPGEREQLGRYAHLAEHLRNAGHHVLWWSSSFSHRFKRIVDPHGVRKGAAEWGIEVRLVPASPYRTNVSLRRLWNHRQFGRRFARQAHEESPPDLIVASSPPLESACAASRLGRLWAVPTVIDIQDQWPDNFVNLVPRSLRGLGRLALRPYYALERKAYRWATGISGVAQGYVDHGVAVGGAKGHQGVFPLGVSLRELDQAGQRGAARHAERWRKPDHQIWMLYSGSLSHSYDFLTIVRAAITSKGRYGARVCFLLTGTGELAEHARRLVRQHDLDNVCLTGFLEFDEYAYLLSQADVGFNASFPHALIYLPNKMFYYLAAGAAILNTIPGECAELVERHGCGLSYTAGDAQGCFQAISSLVESPDRLRAMGAASRQLAEQVFDRPIVYANMTRFLEAVAQGPPRP